MASIFKISPEMSRIGFSLIRKPVIDESDKEIYYSWLANERINRVESGRGPVRP